MVTDPAVLASLSGTAPAPYKAEAVAEPYRGMEPAWDMYAVPQFTRIEIPTRLRRHENHRLKEVAARLEECAALIREMATEQDAKQEFLMLRLVSCARHTSQLIGKVTKARGN